MADYTLRILTPEQGDGRYVQQAKLDETISAATNSLVPGIVAEVLSEETTVEEAALLAVEAAAADLSLVERGYHEQEDVVLSFVDAEDNRTWLEVGTDGRPTAYSKLLLAEDFIQLETIPEVAEVAVSFTDSLGNRTWLESGYDGTPTPYALDMIRKAEARVTSWAAYGDSTTQGTGVDGITAGQGWVELLANDLGVVISNMGAAGARAEEITARLGGIVPTATVSGNQIPASGQVALTDLNVDPVRAGNISSYSVILRTQSGVEIPGVVSRSGSNRYFTRTTAGSAVSTADGQVELYADSGRAHQAGVVILGQGINNEGLITGGTQTVSQLKAWYRAATSVVSSGKLVVWGMLDRGTTEAPGTPVGDIIAEMEAWLAETYGADYAPVRQYLASSQAFLDAKIFQESFTPTANDLAAQAAGVVPPSFRTSSGSVHLNVLGHQLQARYIKRFITSPQKGWA